jgi:hypothetical protein
MPNRVNITPNGMINREGTEPMCINGFKKRDFHYGTGVASE